MKYTKKEAKDWAKETYKGLENCLLPSYTPDMMSLDEKGIRHDVRMAIKNGFFSTCIVGDTAMTFEEFKRLAEIAVDEARGKINVTAYVIANTIEEQIAWLQAGEAIGLDAALLGLPPNFYPTSEEQIYEVNRVMMDSTNLAINLYPSVKHNFMRLHFSGANPHTYNRLADLDNAVAMKVGTGDHGWIFEAFRLFGHKILVNSPMDAHFPELITHHGQQWAGCGPWEIYQTPENPRLVNYFNMLQRGEVDAAMEIFWQLSPARLTLTEMVIPTAYLGVYHYPQWKYTQWLLGGNGGMTKTPVMRLYDHDKMKIKNALAMMGITPVGVNEEEFYVGRSAYGSLG